MIERVLQLIKSSEKSENALEKAIGLAQGSIKNWRNGKSRPSLDAVSKIADYFNVSVDYLLGKTDNQTPPYSSQKEISVPARYGEILVALNEGDKNLSQEDIDRIIQFIKFTKNQNN